MRLKIIVIIFCWSFFYCVCSVGYILNITREIDNFFPGIFEYCNVRIYDCEDSDLLKHWSRTFDFINKARLSFVFCLIPASSLALHQYLTLLIRHQEALGSCKKTYSSNYIGFCKETFGKLLS